MEIQNLSRAVRWPRRSGYPRHHPVCTLRSSGPTKLVRFAKGNKAPPKSCTSGRRVADPIARPTTREARTGRIHLIRLDAMLPGHIALHLVIERPTQQIVTPTPWTLTADGNSPWQATPSAS